MGKYRKSLSRVLKRSKASKAAQLREKRRKFSKLEEKSTNSVSNNVSPPLMDLESVWDNSEDLTISPSVSNNVSPPLMDLESVWDNSEDLTISPSAVQQTYSRKITLTPNSQDSEMQYNNACGSNETCESIMDHNLITERDPSTSTHFELPGNRVVDISYYSKTLINLQYDHNRVCTFGKLKLAGENNRGIGLVSKIIFQCETCEKKYFIMTEDPKKNKSVINSGVVWGTLSAGSTYAHTTELFSSMDIPAMSQKIFKTYENQLCSTWEASFTECIEAAGQEELRKAKEKGQVDKDGIPWTTVYVDGGWSKRSYGHNYNANSGVGVIIGKETGKVLFVGIRNKYCVICARAQNKNEDPSNHVCYRNWSGSSSAMEADIIVEGFNKSIEIHGLRYKKFIADGDSSVYAKIKEKVLYGNEVQKLECINHAIKNYGKALFRLKLEKSISPTGRKYLTVTNIKKLQKEAQRVIYDQINNDADILKEHLEKSPEIAFSADIINSMKDSGIYYHIIGSLQPLIKKAPLLIGKETNNKAECFMNILARFTAGKRLNLIQKNSFQTRAILTGLRYNSGIQWHRTSWKQHFCASPGKPFKKFISSYKKHREDKISKRRVKLYQQTVLPHKNTDYGPQAEQPELSEDEIIAESNRLLKKLQVTKEQQLEIELKTKGQFENELYVLQRKNRLTASNFGSVIKRKLKTFHPLVKKILYAPNINTPAIQYGKTKECVARRKFEIETGLKVKDSGLFIDQDYGFLGATPDGLINDTEIIEIKCLYSLSTTTGSIEEAIAGKRNCCLEIKNNKATLKKNHDYYYQIQGQLHIADKSCCYFVVYRNDMSDLFIEKIMRDDVFWEQNMLPKLIFFYKESLLKEIICRRIPRGLTCLEPKQ